MSLPGAGVSGCSLGAAAALCWTLGCAPAEKERGQTDGPPGTSGQDAGGDRQAGGGTGGGAGGTGGTAAGGAGTGGQGAAGGSAAGGQGGVPGAPAADAGGEVPVGSPPAAVGQVLSVNYGHSCAVLPSGTVKCWGLNQFGQLGTGMANTGDTMGRQPTSTPVAASVVSAPVVNVAVGRSNTCVRFSGMNLQCFGFNSYGTLGNGNTTSSAQAHNVLGIANALVLRGGEPSMCAVLADRTVKCWGNNDWGQLGDGSNMARSTPVTVPGLADVVDVAIGWRSVCALLAGGTLRCWGNNDAGQLGNGTQTSSRMPVMVTGIDNATAINGLGYAAACALLADRTVRCWGINERGQLGNGTGRPSSVPVPVVGVSEATAVAVGAESACAAVAGGRVKCWGELVSSDVPVDIAGVEGAAALSVGKSHACAVLGDRSVRCWGGNEYGQLGDGSTRSSGAAVRVLGIP